jgi:hypothetical protein
VIVYFKWTHRLSCPWIFTACVRCVTSVFGGVACWSSSNMSAIHMPIAVETLKQLQHAMRPKLKILLHIGPNDSCWIGTNSVEVTCISASEILLSLSKLNWTGRICHRPSVATAPIITCNGNWRVMSPNNSVTAMSLHTPLSIVPFPPTTLYPLRPLAELWCLQIAVLPI